MKPRILVTTDGKPGASGALRMARHLRESTQARVEVLAVCEPLDFYGIGFPDSGMATIPPQHTPATLGLAEQRVRSQLADIGDGAAEWPLSLEVGPVAATIARYAAEHGSRLILLGLHEQGTVGRWMSRETLLRVIHLAHVPVLAVPERVSTLPRTVVIAVDFSDFSLRAAHQAIAGPARGAHLHLIHVSPPPRALETWMVSLEWLGVYRAEAERRLKGLAAELERSAAVTVDTHLRGGDAGPEVLRLAEQVGADLIVAGSHGSGFLGRLVMGSVSGALVHGAHCSLLITPPQTIASELQLDLSKREPLVGVGTAGGVAATQGRTPV
jgi:nucleotide-binding universal stress UspA family protein